MHVPFYEKLGLGLLVTAWLVYGGDKLGDMLVHADEGNVEALMIVAAEDTGSEAAEPEVQVDFGALLASADAGAGEKVFKKCASCHSFEPGGGAKVGPPLWGVVGRGIASADGFAYSDALSGLGGTWTPEELGHFLESPKDYAPGNKMTFRGLSKPEQRAAVIVYLESAN